MIKKILKILLQQNIFKKFYNGKEILIFLDIDRTDGWFIQFCVQSKKDLYSDKIFLNYFEHEGEIISNKINNLYQYFFLEKKEKLKLYYEDNFRI